MDRLVQRYLKTAIGFLALGLGLGAVMIARRELQGVYPSPYWISAHTHALLVGFVMMMIQGVALWMFPRPERGDVRYRPGRPRGDQNDGAERVLRRLRQHREAHALFIICS